MTVEPTTRAVIDAMTELFPRVGVNVHDAVEARQVIAQIPPLEATPQPVHAVEDRKAGEIPVRVYWPGPQQGLPILIYFHGGGFSLCTLDTHDNVCRALCADAGVIVVSVDYRLAPEDPYPAAVDDAYAATRWAHEHADELGGDPGRLIVAGDSAGGNLAAVTCIRSRDEGGPPIAFQVLVYPATDAAMDSSSHRENAEGYFLTGDAMRWYWNNYMPDPLRREEPYCSPINADLHDLPPALVLTAQYDPLRDEGEAYGARLREAGVRARTVRFDGMFHGFFGLGALLPAAKEAMAVVCEAVRRV
ncbi:MAG: alpha/beta hydrolase [Thermoactinospora sp.]|nr:alpha/beta hydrolase [Thermoactinospora sp.]